jgi:hypothetical protein
MRSLNRREMLHLSSAASIAALGSTVPEVASGSVTETDHAPIPQWEVFELALAGPSSGNPFTDVQLTATFALGHRTVAVEGFYDGRGTLCVGADVGLPEHLVVARQ